MLFTIQAAVREQEAKPGRALQEEYLSPEEKMRLGRALGGRMRRSSGSSFHRRLKFEIADLSQQLVL